MERLLENDQIRLRALEPEDLDTLFLWENNTEWWGVGHTLTPYSRYLLKAYIRESARDIYETKQLRLMIELKNERKPIGMIDLYDFDPYHRKAGVGILLDTDYRNNGYARVAMLLLAGYAFNYLKLHQLYAYVQASNMGSRSLFTNCGFTVNGVFKDWLERGGAFEDALLMQLISP